MIASKKQSVEDILIETLAKNPYTEGPELVFLINKIRPNTTKQAVYTALKSLLESETVAKIKTKYFLSRLWLHKVNNLFKIQKEKEIVKDVIFDLREKESISYHFPSLLSCDTYWAHIFTLLIDWVPKENPVFVWNPHEIFTVGRNQTEKACFEEFQEKNKHAFFTTRNYYPLDLEIKKTWSNSHISISTNNKLNFEDKYYLNIFSDFLIEVYLNEKIVKEIEEFYKNNKKITEENIKTFENIFSKKCPVRMKISRNKNKASLLRKKLAKDFYIPKDLKL